MRPGFATRFHRHRWLESALATLLLCLPEAALAAPLEQVQAGRATILSGQTSTTVSIATVDPSKSFLVFGVNGSAVNPRDIQVSGQISGSASLSFARAGTAGSLSVHWYVAEFRSGVKVQRGTLQLPSGSKSATVSIAAVDLSKSFPLVTLRTPGSNIDGNDFVQATLTDPTHLKLDWAGGTVNPSFVEWQVIEYADALVFSGSFSMNANQPQVTLSPPLSGNEWLVYSYTTGDSAFTIGRHMVQGSLQGGRIVFKRDATGVDVSGTWYVVRFEDATTVQHDEETLAASELFNDVSISTIIPENSIAVAGMGTRGGKTPHSVVNGDDPGVGWFNMNLTSSTNLRVTRGVTGSPASSASLGWFVIQFSHRPLSIVKRAFQVDGRPIASGSTMPAGTPVRFMLYINNPDMTLDDVGIQDVLDPAFAYVPGSARYDNSPIRCASMSCTVSEEAAIFAAADTGVAVTDAADGDLFSAAGPNLYVGDGVIGGNLQADLAAQRVWALVFTAQLQ